MSSGEEESEERQLSIEVEDGKTGLMFEGRVG
jgi:hypothetical protein